MRFRAQIKNKGIQFDSDRTKAKLISLEGAYLIIEVDDKPTSNMRRYFEGAVIPAIYYQHPKSGWADFKECREAIKLEFIPGYFNDLGGVRQKTARSTTELNKGRFRAFLDQITDWMQSNGLEVPDPEDYKNWRDSAPDAGEIYPPLKRLMELYSQQRAAPL